MALKTECTDERIRIFDGETLLASYRFKTWQSKPYFEHVALPADCGEHAGENLVLVCPHDHVWHFGLWFAQKRVDEINFWEVEALRVEKSKPYGECVHVGLFEVKPNSGRSVAFGQRIDWVSEHGEKILEERRTIEVHAPRDRAYRIDWTIELKAVGADRTLNSFGRWGHYSGLCWRPIRSLYGGDWCNAEFEYFWNVTAERSKWCDFTGKLDRSPVFLKPEQAGMTMFDHPGNPGYPTRWYAVYEPFAFLNANRTYNSEFPIAKDATTTWRYGVFVHYGAADRARIEAEYANYAG